MKIAKNYIEQGGKTIFFSHGGKYVNIVKDIGCDIVSLEPLYHRSFFRTKLTSEDTFFKIFTRETIQDFVEQEIEAFKKNGIEFLVNSFNLTSCISARALKLPLFVIISGTSIPPYFKSQFATYPENYENFFTKLIPNYLKNRIAQWYLLNNKMLVKDFNYVAKKYNVKPFKNLNDILLGDHTLVCDDINFIGLKPTNEFPLENYTGPIYQWNLIQEQNKEIEKKIKLHLKRPGKSILLSMGSSGKENIFLKILETLNKTDYNVIAICTNIYEIKNIPKMNDNILLLQYVKSAFMLNKMVDLAIIHGGRGTVYTAAYSGKPAIGLPKHIEQQYNIDCLVRNGTAIRIPMKNFKQQHLTNSLDKIFNNYDSYLINAKNLLAKLPHDSGEKKATSRIIEIIETHYKKNATK